jgi:hypothetical protein
MTQLPGVAGEIEETIGLDLTVKLLKARGGTVLKVPKKAKGTVLADLIGLDAASLLIEKFGIRNLDLPCGHMRGRDAERLEKKRRAFAMLGDGKSLREVALACDISVRTATEYRSQLKHRGPPDQTQFLF